MDVQLIAGDDDLKHTDESKQVDIPSHPSGIFRHLTIHNYIIMCLPYPFFMWFIFSYFKHFPCHFANSRQVHNYIIMTIVATYFTTNTLIQYLLIYLMWLISFTLFPFMTCIHTSPANNVMLFVFARI